MIKILLMFICSVSAWAQVEESEVMRAMRLGCDKERLGLGCYNYANMLIKKGQPERADAYFIKACQYKNQDGCDKKIWETKTVKPEIKI